MPKNKLFLLGLYVAIGLFFSACHGGQLSQDINMEVDTGIPQIVRKYEKDTHYFDRMPKDKTVVAARGEATSGYSLAMPNPFVSCDSMEEAARMAGFDMVLPKIPDRLEVLKGVMIQVFYGENGQDMLIRKARGEGDISGDYNHYAQVETIDGITVKGKNNAFFLAVWARDGYAYSISVSQALSQPELLALVAVVR